MAQEADVIAVWKPTGWASRACKGILMRHEDGTPMWCSEEMEGRVCGDYDSHRHRLFETCRVAFVHGCAKCEEVPQAFP